MFRRGELLYRCKSCFVAITEREFYRTREHQFIEISHSAQNPAMSIIAIIAGDVSACYEGPWRGCDSSVEDLTCQRVYALVTEVTLASNATQE
jgi:hypothetical protein